jgi:hypothetical protein
VGVETSSVGGEGEKAGGRRRKARAWWSEREAAVPLCVVSAAGKMLDGLEAEAARLALAGSGWLWLAVSLSLSHAGKQAGTTLRHSQAATGSDRGQGFGLGSMLLAGSEVAAFCWWRQTAERW